MTTFRHRALRGAIALGLTATGLTQLGWAQRAVTLTAVERSGYGRLMARWGDGDETSIGVKAALENRVLVLTFPEPVTMDMDDAREALPNWIALARLDASGMTARFALKEEAVRLHMSTSIDIDAVDILLEDAADPPDVVSPLVAKRAAAVVQAVEAAKPPPKPFAESLDIRGSDAAGRSRVALYWSEPIEYEIAEEAGLISLQFNRRANPDIARLRIAPPEHVTGIQVENLDIGLRVDIEIGDGLDVAHYKEDGDTVILDLAGREARQAARAANAEVKALADDIPSPSAADDTPAAPETTRASASVATRDEPADKAHASPEQHAQKPDAVHSDAPDADHAEVERPQEAPAKPVVRTVAEPARSDQAPAPPERSGLGDLSPIVVNSDAAGPAMRETVLRQGWANPAPPSGQIQLDVSGTSNGMQIIAPWTAPAPAAVFYRSPATWIVFGADARIEFDSGNAPPGFDIKQVEADGAIVLRVTAPDGMVASARTDGPSWIITFAPAAVQPERFLKPVREISETGRYTIETQMIGAAGIVWFEDSAIGDVIAAAISFGPSASSTTPQSFIEAEMPATAHGLAVVPRSDDIAVRLIEERVIVGNAAGGMAVSSKSAATTSSYTAMNTDGPTPGFIDFDAWGGLSGNAYYGRQNELVKAIAARDQNTRAGAEVALELARFYLAHDLASEALGALRQSLKGKPLLKQEARYLALSGAALVMLRRYEQAESDLSKGALRGDDSAHIWRGYAAAEMGQWERANDFFKLGEELIFAYSDRWAAAFYAKAAEAALRTNDLDRARRLAERSGAYSYQRPAEDAAMVLAQLAEVTEGEEAAYKRYANLTSDVSEPVAVQAELRRLDLGVKLGKVSPMEAADQLEALRFRWRGDGIEMATVGILADQYMRLSRFREALLLAQSAALRDPDAKGARELRIRLMEYFRRLYLDGEADRLDPIQALALFYEFKALTPIGADGDRMIRKLARRLVSFDLLDPATELLQHQVDNRVRGQGKAAIAADLASIYLMDRQPDRALAAINASRQPRLEKKLARERRLLEAAAHRDMERYDHAIELMDGVPGRDAASIRADAYWRDQKWADAAKELSLMLPDRDQAQAADADIVMKTAIAGRMAKEMGLLSRLRDDYAPLFENSANAESFDLITSQTDISGAALSEAVRRLADAPRVDAFAASLKRRFDGEGEQAGGDDPPAGAEGGGR